MHGRTRVIVTGDRGWWCHDLAADVVARLLARYGPGLVVVHGAASGVDAAFDGAAADAGVDREPHPADWDNIDHPRAVVRRRRDGKLYDAAAGPNRNGDMVKAGAILCLAVHRDIRSSKGTLDCARRCLAAGIPVWLINDEAAMPKRIERI